MLSTCDILPIIALSVSGTSQAYSVLHRRKWCSVAVRVDIVGQVFGRLKVLAFWDVDKTRKLRWLCQCSCGTRAIVRGGCLKSGHTTSCGCYFLEAITKHHMSLSTEYGSWRSMVNRCENPTDGAYLSYGGRGIKICEAWRNSFESFLEDMGPKPSPKHSIDRIDNNKGYYPDNCRWSTQKEQMNNRECCVHLTARGETKTLSEWSREVHLPISTIRQRLSKGWDHEKALFSVRYSNRMRGE